MYVKVTDGNAEIYSIGKLRKDNPNTSFPRSIPDATLAAYNVYTYTVDDEPSIDERTQVVEEGGFTGSGSTWTLGWNVVSKSAEDIAAYDEKISAENRTKRNELLAETDYLALSDNTLSSEMAAYRQALRDITSHANFPNLSDSDWPTKP